MKNLTFAFKKSSPASHLQITAILVPNRPEDLPVGTLLSVASGGKNLNDNTNTKSWRLTRRSVSVSFSQVRESWK